jgi:hypothetical protein
MRPLSITKAAASRVKPLARTDVDVAEIDGEAVVFDPRTLQAHYLNHSAALVFGLCDGETTIFDMAEAIADVYEMPDDEVEGQVRSLLRDLRTFGVLEGKNAPSEMAQEAGADERGLIRIKVPPSS